MDETELLAAIDYIFNNVDYRSPEEIAEDDFWIKKTTGAIIQRRKDKALQSEKDHGSEG